MAPPSPGSSPGAAPLPPLPNLSGGGAGQGAAPGGQSAMASLVSGVAPVKKSVDSIIQECQAIVKSGAIPGAEQPCSQIVALASSLLPMAIQQAMQPGVQGAPPPPPTGGPGPVPGMGM